MFPSPVSIDIMRIGAHLVYVAQREYVTLHATVPLRVVERRVTTQDHHNLPSLHSGRSPDTVML